MQRLDKIRNLLNIFQSNKLKLDKIFNHGLGELGALEVGGLVPGALEQRALGLGALAQGGQGLACKLGADEPLRRT